MITLLTLWETLLPRFAHQFLVLHRLTQQHPNRDFASAFLSALRLHLLWVNLGRQIVLHCQLLSQVWVPRAAELVTSEMECPV